MTKTTNSAEGMPEWVEQLAQSWDGCMYEDAPGGEIDIGASIRRAALAATHCYDLGRAAAPNAPLYDPREVAFSAQAAPQAVQAATESVLIDGAAYEVHADVAAELLRLHIELQQSPAHPAEGVPAQAAALLATGGLAQAVDADSLKLLSDIRAMVESTIKAGLVDDRELLHTFETIAKTAAKAKRPTCAICDSKGFIAFDDESARGRNGGRWGVCKACTHEAPQAQADARDAERWREAIKHVGAEHRFSADRYVIRGLEAPSNVTRGSVAGHFTKSIDAAIADQAKQGGM